MKSWEVPKFIRARFFHHQQFIQFLRFDQAQKFQRNPNTTSVFKHFFCSRWNLKNLLLVTVTWNIRRRIIAGLALSSCSSSSSAFPCLSHKLQVLIVVAWADQYAIETLIQNSQIEAFNWPKEGSFCANHLHHSQQDWFHDCKNKCPKQGIAYNIYIYIWNKVWAGGITKRFQFSCTHRSCNVLPVVMSSHKIYYARTNIGTTHTHTHPTTKKQKNNTKQTKNEINMRKQQKQTPR